jgi:phospholipid/cholesterol/gamma-HCH transport system substrate-binding protein
METRVAYAAVGAFVIALTAALIGLGLWLGADIETKRYTPYMFLTSESASGINPGTVVRYRGVEVGRVKQLHLDNPEQVRILLDIEEGTPIKTDTRASIATQGVTGLAFIELTGGTVSAPDLRPGPDGAPPLIPPAPSLLRRLDVAVSRNLENLDRIALQLQDLLNEENRAAFATLIRNLATLSGTLAQERGRMSEVLANSERMTRAGAETLERLPETLVQLEGTLEEVRTAASTFRETSRTVSEVSRATQQEITAMRRGMEPGLDNLLRQVESATGVIEDLARRLRRDPAQLLRGAPAKEPGPGEQ